MRPMYQDEYGYFHSLQRADIIPGIGWTDTPAYFSETSAFSPVLVYCAVGNDILYYNPRYDQLDLSILDKINSITHSDAHASQAVNVKSDNDMLFDLTGRRLAAPPARGVYIEEGKIKLKD